MEWNSLVPELTVSNFDNSLYFYVHILGFEIKYQRKNPRFAYLEFESSQIMIEEYHGTWNTVNLEYPYGRGVNFQIECKDVQRIRTALENAHYEIYRQMQDTWYDTETGPVGAKELLVRDPDGYLLRFSQDLGTEKYD